MKKFKKYKQLMALISSGVLGLSLVGSDKRVEEYCKNYSLSTSLSDNQDLSEEFLREIEMINNMQNMYLDKRNETYGRNYEKINYDKIVENHDQTSAAYFYQDKCVKKISSNTVWLKTEEGSITYKIDDNSYSIITMDNQTNTRIEKKYNSNNTYTIKRISEDYGRQIIEQKLPDGTNRKWYYKQDERPIELNADNARINYYLHYYDVACISCDKNNNVEKITTIAKDSKEIRECLVYPNKKTTTTIKKVIDENDNIIRTEKSEYLDNILQKQYTDDNLVKELKDGKYYYYENNEIQYYEIETENGVTRYSPDNIKILYKDYNNDTETTYYKNGNIDTIYDIKNNIQKGYYDTKELRYIITNDEQKYYYKSKKIEAIYNEDGEKKWYENGDLRYIGNGENAEAYYKNGKISMKKQGDTITTYYLNGEVEKKCSGNVSTIEFHGEEITYGVFADNILQYSPDKNLIYEKHENEEKWYYKSNNLFATKKDDQTLGYYENGNPYFIINENESQVFYESGPLMHKFYGEISLYIDSNCWEPIINYYLIDNYTSYYENGNKKEEKLNGEITTYYKETNQDTYYVKKDGICTFYEDGEMVYECPDNAAIIKFKNEDETPYLYIILESGERIEIGKKTYTK